MCNKGITGKSSTTIIIMMVLALSAGILSSFSVSEEGKMCSIKVEQQDKMTQFTSLFHNQKDQSFIGKYSFEAIKEGVSGKSTSRQGGVIEAKPLEQVTLSTSSLNILEGDTYTIVLKVFSNELLLCTDSITVKK